MADGSVRETNHVDILHTALIGMKDDFCLELAIPRLILEPDGLADCARQMRDWASATLHFARYRGDAEDDLPGTLDGALAASEFLLQLAAGFDEAAQKARQERGGRND